MTAMKAFPLSRQRAFAVDQDVDRGNDEHVNAVDTNRPKMMDHARPLKIGSSVMAMSEQSRPRR